MDTLVPRMWEEVPYVVLFAFVLALVQLQFHWCVPCMVNAAKVAEAGLLVALFRAWVTRDEWLRAGGWTGADWDVLPDSARVAEYVQTLAAALRDQRNHTEL